jgi:hypothetical protein
LTVAASFSVAAHQAPATASSLDNNGAQCAAPGFALATDATDF